MTEISKDTLFEGQLACYQNKNGYRFSVDAVLLAHFCLHWKKAEILDLGCGCGVLGFILLYRNFKNIKLIQGLEYQAGLVELAKQNIHLNAYEKKMSVQQGDYRNLAQYFDAESFTHIICNPPFYNIGRGRTSENNEAFVARHQITSSPKIIAESIAYGLKNKGEAGIIYPADSLLGLTKELLLKRLEPKALQFVYSYPDSGHANLVLVLCRKNGGEGLKVLSPLYIYTSKNGKYSEDVQKMYASYNREISS